MFETYSQEAQFALRVVEPAAKLCRQIQHELVLPAVSKADHSPVTVADFASQAIIAHQLEEAFPDIPLVAEEDSRLLKRPEQAGALEAVHKYVAGFYPGVSAETVCEWIDWGAGEVGEYFWTLDPIDGTKGFLRGEQYVVALALVKDGGVVVGAMGCPTLDAQMQPDLGGTGSVALAVKGEGAWARGMGERDLRPLKVSDCSSGDCLRLLRSYEPSHTDPEKTDFVAHELGIVHPSIPMDSAAKYAILANGGAELVLRLLSPNHPDYVENIWDHAAGSLILEEAGGRITDLGGNPLAFGVGRRLKENVGILASNGPLHDRILEIIARIGADRRPTSS